MPAPSCKLSAGFGSINISAIFLLFLSDSRFLLAKLYCLPLFLFFHTSCSTYPVFLPPILSGYNGSSATHSLRLMTRPRTCPDEARCFRYPQFLVASLFLDVAFILLFFRRRTVSPKFFDTQSPSIFAEELVLSHHAGCVLSLFRCNGQGLLLNTCLFRYGRIETRTCSTCGHPTHDTSHLTLSCLFTGSLHRLLFGDSFSICDFWFKF